MLQPSPLSFVGRGTVPAGLLALCPQQHRQWGNGEHTWRDEAWGSHPWGGSFSSRRTAGLHRRPAGSSPKANTRMQLCPHFRLHSRAPCHRTGRATGSQPCGRRQDTYTAENPQGHQRARVSSLPKQGFLCNRGNHTMLRQKSFGLAGRGFALPASPCTPLGAGVPRPDPHACTSVHFLTGHQPERWETSLFLQKGEEKPR